VDEKIYFVWGGVFSNTHFQDLLPGAEECYGPYHNLPEAEQIWSEKTRRMVDVAAHRMFVLTVDRPHGHHG
jgi:hypothetical protein